MTDKSQAAAVS